MITRYKELEKKLSKAEVYEEPLDLFVNDFVQLNTCLWYVYLILLCLLYSYHHANNLGTLAITQENYKSSLWFSETQVPRSLQSLS